MPVRNIETPFSRAEYNTRVERVKERMAQRNLDVLISSDPTHITYLTGYDADSYYVPQAVVVARTLDDPLWFSRQLDVGCALVTTYLDQENLIGYGEEYVVDTVRLHPMAVLAETLTQRGLASSRIGTEEDGFCFTPRALAVLKEALPLATFVDASLLINWVRTVKSPAEIEVMREAGQLAIGAMQTAASVIRAGERECDAAGQIYHRLISGNGTLGGHEPHRPSMPSGAKTATPHLSWSDDRYQRGTSVNVELGGGRHRYNVGLARTIWLDTPPDDMKRLAEITTAGFEALLARVAPGTTCSDLATVFNDHLRRNGHFKNERCGYAIGMGYPPSGWVERTFSVAQGDATRLEPNMTLHVIVGMWLDGGSYLLSESVAVTDDGYEPLSHFTRDLLVSD